MPSTAPTVSTLGSLGPCPLPGGSSGARVEPLDQGQLHSAVARPRGPAVPGAGAAQPSLALTLPTLCSARHTVLGPRLDPAGLSTMSWPFSSSATMPRAPPAPVPGSGLWFQAGPSFQPLPEHWAQLGITLLHHHLPHSQALQEHPSGAWGRLPRAIGFAAVPLTCPPEIFLLLLQERFLGSQPLRGAEAAPTHC